jgi:transcriptional regulator with XRE-family HTH domain
VLYNGLVETMTQLGVRVRELRKARGWSQQRLGDEAGVTAQTVWLLETHQLNDVKLSTLSKISDAMGVSLTDLLA